MAARGKYPDSKILMIGDAPGDYKAAKENGALFFPVVPGHENRSWKLFLKRLSINSCKEIIRLSYQDS